MKGCLASTLFILKLVLCIHGSVGVLRVHHDDGHQETIDTATFVYFGPQNPEVHEVRMLWLDAGEICKADLLDTRDIKGRFIITRGVMSGCNINEAYARLEKAGAAAFAVQTFTGTPGLYSFARSDWVRRPATGEMPFVDVQVAFDAIGASGLIVDLEEPHSREYQDRFTSWTWTLVLRVALPAFSLYTTLLGAHTAYSRWHPRVSSSSSSSSSNRRPLGFYIGLIEMVASATISVNLAMGLFGPILMPFRFYHAFFFLLPGSSMFSMVLLALLAREKTRSLNNLVARDLWVHYTKTLICCGSIFLGSDLFVMIFFVFNVGSQRSGLAMRVLSTPVHIVGQIVAGVYFFYEVKSISCFECFSILIGAITPVSNYRLISSCF
jgi:hypothetical protein